MLTGENGILNKTSKAKEEQEKANARERLQVELMAIKTEVLSNNEEVGLDKLDAKKDELAKKNIIVAENGVPREVILDEYKFRVKEDLTIDGYGESAVKDSYGEFSFESLEEAVQNPLLMSELLKSKSAVDYMVNNQDMMNKVINSSVAMSELGKSEYASQKVITDESIFNKIINSSYFQEFSNSRMLIPELSGNTNSVGTASSTGSMYYQPYQAFDRINTTSWGIGSLGTLQFKFNQSKYAYKLNLVLKSNAGLNALTNQFKGIITLKLGNQEVYSTGEKTFSLDNEFNIVLSQSVKFDTIIFNATSTISSTGANWAGITEMQVFGCDSI